MSRSAPARKSSYDDRRTIRQSRDELPGQEVTTGTLTWPWGLPVSVDEVAASTTRSPSGGFPASKVRDDLNVGVLDYLDAIPLSCGIT